MTQIFNLDRRNKFVLVFPGSPPGCMVNGGSSHGSRGTQGKASSVAKRELVAHDRGARGRPAEASGDPDVRSQPASGGNARRVRRTGDRRAPAQGDHVRSGVLPG